MRKRPNAKRNIILFVTALAIVIGLIVVVGMTRHTVMIMTPESPEMVAKRQAPDNAYLVLQDAERALPAPPASAPQLAQGLAAGVKRLDAQFRGRPRPLDRGVESYRATKPATVAARFGTDRPDDDPELAAYAQRCEPVIAKIREALAKPYCLPPVDWASFTEMPWNLYQAPPAFVGRLGDVTIGEALFAFRVSKDATKGVEHILTAARLGAMIQRDGPISFYECGGTLQQDALHALDEFMPACAENLAGPLLKDLEALRRSVPSPSGVLEFQWRVIDNVMRLKMDERFEGGPEEREFGMQLMFNTQMKGLRQLVATYKADFAEAVGLSYPDFIAWKAVHPALTQRGGRFGGTDPVNLVSRLVLWRALVETYYAGAEISLALELHRHAHQRYPDTLDALAPEHLQALPPDPFTGKPFLFRLDGDGYWLYSAGFNQADDGGRELNPQELSTMIMWFGGMDTRRSGRRNDADIVIHRPAPPPPPAPPATP